MPYRIGIRRGRISEFADTTTLRLGSAEHFTDYTPRECGHANTAR
ncbi:hypothetical protein ACFWBG_30385 [Nocardia salmonicida]